MNAEVTSPTTPAQCRWHAVADLSALHHAALNVILDSAALAIQHRGQFHLVISGGETPREIYRQLRATHNDWPTWHIYFSDERCLPATDINRNSRMAGEAWLDHVPIPAEQVHIIPGELGANQATCKYAETLCTVGIFDLVLLGLGEDAHTASLFPQHEWGIAPGSPDTLAVLDAPKSPAQRVSLSAMRLSRSRQVLFLVAGKSKYEAVTAWRSGKVIPARAITPASGVDVLIEAALLPVQSETIE